MKAETRKNIVDTFEKLYKIISSFSDTELNTIPFQGSWTGGQTAQHIIMACSGYPKLFSGNTEETKRKPDEKVKEIDDLFLNFTVKMNAPEFLLPDNKEYNKSNQISKLLQIENELLESTEKFDLTLTCLDFQLPGFDKFTVYEWIDFALVHTQRHTNQLNNIHKYLNKS